jgi:hypothetical protein
MQSFHNSYYSTKQTTQPEIGMGATVCFFSDRRAGTIIWHKGNTIVVQLDKASRTDNNGTSDMQEYSYEQNRNGAQYEFTLRKNGKWVAKGHGMKNGTSCGIGFRREYYDFSF